MTKAFDLISAEYGWSDDVILDLTLRRIRQIVSAISQRQFLQRRLTDQQITWMARVVTSFMVATTPTEKAGQLDGLHQAANRLAFGTESVPESEQEETNEPTRGSYEKFTSMMFGRSR